MFQTTKQNYGAYQLPPLIITIFIFPMSHARSKIGFPHSTHSPLNLHSLPGFHDFSMVFLWLSFDFPLVVLWLSHCFPFVFLWYSYGFPVVFVWFFYGFPTIFLWFSHFNTVFPSFFHGFPMPTPRLFRPWTMRRTEAQKPNMHMLKRAAWRFQM